MKGLSKIGEFRLTTLVVIMGMMIGIACGEGEGGEIEPTFSLTARMRDGSVIKGIPLFGDMSMMTPYGTLCVPLDDLMEVAVCKSNDAVSAVCVLRNKDRISGRIATNVLEVRTPYGYLVLPVTDVVNVAVMPDSTCAQPTNSALNEGLLLRLSFDGTGKDSFMDSSGGFSRHASRVGAPKFIPQGRCGAALHCDGRWSFFAIAPLGILSASNMTWSVWINPRVQQHAPVLEFSSNNYHYGPHLWITPEGRVYMNFWGSPGNDRVVITPPAMITPGEWVHIACVYDGRRGIVYVNGEEVADQTFGSLSLQLGHPFYIGARQGWSAGNVVFDGFIDEVYVYTRALQADEIRSLAFQDGPSLQSECPTQPKSFTTGPVLP